MSKEDIWDSIFIPIYIKASLSKAGIKSLHFFFNQNKVIFSKTLLHLYKWTREPYTHISALVTHQSLLQSIPHVELDTQWERWMSKESKQCLPLGKNYFLTHDLDPRIMVLNVPNTITQ